jgi:hypothetical protein
MRSKSEGNHMEAIECVQCDGITLAYLIRGESDSDATTFLTPPELGFQAGFIAYGSGNQIQRHVHKRIERRVADSSEFLLLKKGRCIVDIYDDSRNLVATRELRAGDSLLLVAGGHGFQLLEDTVFLEIKQGPYVGVGEKERF